MGEVDHGIWERVQLLERHLGVAVAEENYAGASRIRDQLTNLKSRMTPGEQFLLTYSARARSGSLGQRMTALAAMGELGDHRALPVLLEGLRDKNSLVVEQTEKAMWKIFMRSGREDIDRKLQDGVELLMTKDGYKKAKKILTEIINEAPSFAEGFNKRATVNYLLEEYDDAIKDCHSTLHLNPYHFGALSGMGLCYAARRELEAALFWFEKALALHPGLHLIGKYIEALKQKIAHQKRNLVDGDQK
jgi:tetratricopeptide (TPR) repeat protein